MVPPRLVAHELLADHLDDGGDRAVLRTDDGDVGQRRHQPVAQRAGEGVRPAHELGGRPFPHQLEPAARWRDAPRTQGGHRDGVRVGVRQQVEGLPAAQDHHLAGAGVHGPAAGTAPEIAGEDGVDRQPAVAAEGQAAPPLIVEAAKIEPRARARVSRSSRTSMSTS
jgi:hypothetical protein